MDQAMTILAALTLVYLIYTFIEFLLGFRSIKNLGLQAVAPSSTLPSVSIIFSALNEEANIEAAVLSLLNIDYPNFEIIAINDRSKDNTSHILNALQQRYGRLHVHHIAELPEGWFGKNHALYYGSQQANGEWLLFTDADVIMKPDALSKSVSYAMEHKLHHLTICEHHCRNTLGLKILLLAQYITYSFSMRPWRIRYSWSKKSLGHGAFNLVQKAAYQHCGTHEAISLECLDDLKLGELIKKNGFRQDTVDGRDYVEREWYADLRTMINGMKKNSFAYFNYHLATFLINFIFALIFFIGPVVLLFSSNTLVRSLSMFNVSLMLLISVYVCKQFRLQKRYAVFYPLAILLLLYTIWNSVCSVYSNRGVVWRGTHYPLAKLRKAKENSVTNDTA